MMELNIPFTAATDLTSLKNRVITRGGVLATTPFTAHGLYGMETTVDSGQDGSMLVFGRGMGTAGGTLSVGDRVQVASGGFFTVAASGDHSYGIVEVAANSGSQFRGVFNFLNMFMSSSAGV